MIVIVVKYIAPLINLVYSKIINSHDANTQLLLVMM